MGQHLECVASAQVYQVDSVPSACRLDTSIDLRDPPTCEFAEIYEPYGVSPWLLEKSVKDLGHKESY